MPSPNVLIAPDKFKGSLTAREVAAALAEGIRAVVPRAQVRELDRQQAQWREAIVSAYETSVVETMDALATCLGAALALDLIGPDDFAPRRFARPAPAPG